jgi:hypothetical protein
MGNSLLTLSFIGPKFYVTELLLDVKNLTS